MYKKNILSVIVEYQTSKYHLNNNKLNKSRTHTNTKRIKMIGAMTDTEKKPFVKIYMNIFIFNFFFWFDVCFHCESSATVIFGNVTQ